jgi:hypothetical protein
VLDDKLNEYKYYFSNKFFVKRCKYDSIGNWFESFTNPRYCFFEINIDKFTLENLLNKEGFEGLANKYFPEILL